jgi:tRNA A37 threonylcarbamoyladenosine synthetase subunit TsaC/SUA5/YrdC
MSIFIIPTNTCFWIACPVWNINDYKNIYKIKARSFEKPLAILCKSFNYLEQNTWLNKEQINFLKKYKKPWTILIDKKNINDKKLLDIIDNLPNSQIYQKIAFRVNHNEIHKKLTTKYNLLFLTSANKSGKSEIFTNYDIKNEFENEIQKYNIKILPKESFEIKSNKQSSDIFEFIWENTEIKYLRKK